MKKLAFVLTALVALPAVAEEALITPNMETSIGEKTRLDSKAIFYLKKKCDLPLVNAKDMRKYVFYRGKDGPNEVGCWGMTIDKTVFSVVLNRPIFTAPIEVLHKADVKDDGTATITGLSEAKRNNR